MVIVDGRRDDEATRQQRNDVSSVDATASLHRRDDNDAAMQQCDGAMMRRHDDATMQ